MAEFEVLKGTVQEIELSKLVNAEWNPQEMSDEEFNRLAQELNEVGMIDPIQVVPLEDGRFKILGGHQRTAAARTLGWTKIPAVVITDKKFQDEDLQKLVTVRLNVLKGRLNPEKFVNLYREMATKYGDNAVGDLLGFTDQDALNKIVHSVKDGLRKAGLPKDLAKQFDKATKEMKSIDGLSLILNRLFNEYGSTLDQNFMVFTFGGKKHLFVSCPKALFNAVETLAEWAKLTKVSITEPLGTLIEGFVRENRLETTVKKLKATQAPTGEPADVSGASFSPSGSEEEELTEDEDDEGETL